MMQMKAIFSRSCATSPFEPVQELDSYRDDVTKMVIQLAQPARVRYRRRGAGDEQLRVVADTGVSTGHQLYQGEAPRRLRLRRGPPTSSLLLVEHPDEGCAPTSPPP